LDKKNVMIIANALTGGGAERLVSDISRGIQDKYNLFVVVYKKNENDYDHGGTRIDLELLSKTKFGKIMCAIKRLIKVRSLKKKYKIDCSISFVPQTDYINVFSRQKGEKVIIDVVSNMSLAFPSGIKRKFRKYILKKADLLITVSEGVRKDLLNNFGCSMEKSKTIYNACDVETIMSSKLSTRQSRDFFSDESGIYICNLGSFRHPKGQWHLLKAFSIVKQEFPNSKLFLLGDGVYRTQLESLARNLKISDSVIMPGFISNVHAIIKRSHVFAFSSIYEGFGNVLVEALACGVPIVSTDCPFGPREILAPETMPNKVASGIEVGEYGILVPPFNSDSIDISSSINDNEKLFGQAIVFLLKNDLLRKEYSEKGLLYCKNFDYKTISEKWIRCIDDCLINRRGDHESYFNNRRSL